MSTYSERLGQFNQAIDATNQHVETLKNTLNNKAIKGKLQTILDLIT